MAMSKRGKRRLEYLLYKVWNSNHQGVSSLFFSFFIKRATKISSTVLILFFNSWRRLVGVMHCLHFSSSLAYELTHKIRRHERVES